MRTVILSASILMAAFIFPTFATNLLSTQQPSESLGEPSGYVTSLNINPIDTHSNPATGMPSRGMTMQQVERDFGAPNSRKAPVGDPPITRWEYSQFIVYFEYRHVIHSVHKR